MMAWHERPNIILLGDKADGLVHRSEDDLRVFVLDAVRKVLCKRRMVGPFSYANTDEAATCMRCLGTRLDEEREED